MRARSASLLSALVILAASLAWYGLRQSSTPSPEAQAAGQSVVLPEAVASAPSQPIATPAALAQPVQPMAVAKAEPAKAIKAFADWVAKYEAAEPQQKEVLVPAGAALAQQRQQQLYQLILSNPEAALAAALPAASRNALPAAVTPWLEEPVYGRGNIVHLDAQGTAKRPAKRQTMHVVQVNGRRYEAHVYGRRAKAVILRDVSLHGIAVNGHLAVQDSPLSLFPRQQLPTGVALQALTGFAEHATATTAEADAPVAVIGNKAFPVCCAMHSGKLTEALLSGESGDASLSISPQATAIPPATPHVLGNKTMLVIIADFSDAVGRPKDTYTSGDPDITTTYVTNRINNDISPWFNEVSYNKTAITSVTVTNVLRLTGTLAGYAATEDSDGLKTAALAAAQTAGFTPANFDRVAVVFANASAISWAGLAERGGEFSWYNGNFDVGVVEHELVHNMGVSHANLWQIPVASTNPLDATGTSVEYGDPFDIMGNSQNNSATKPDHPNPWFLRVIGWMPASAELQVTSSGTYRIRRFDSSSATLTNPLALRISRNTETDYWIGFRKKYTGHASLSDISSGAYVTWGYHTNRQCNLIDIDTPSTSSSTTPEDASLNVGSTLNDTASGISINVVATGGTAPDEYLDIQVNLTPRVAFAATRVFVDEQAGTAKVSLKRLNNSSGNVSVDYATISGTAAAGSDYTASTGTLTWPDGDAADRTISIPITADSIDEGGTAGSETFLVRLSGAVGATISTDTDASVVIHDAGAFDASFEPPFLTSSTNAISVEPDDSIVIGGNFGPSDPIVSGGITRLFDDGTHDTDFDQGEGAAPRPVTAIARQPDGKVIIIGDFTTIHTVARNHIARLNADGTLDTTFNPGVNLSSGASLEAVVVAPDGDIYVGGDFSTWNSQAYRGIVRLNSDGSQDTSFANFDNVVDALPNGLLEVRAIALQPIATAPHYAVVVGGLFTRSPTGSSFRSGIVRVTSSGTLDSSFNVLQGAHNAGSSTTLSRVSCIVPQTNGKLLVGGQFSGFNGVNVGRIVRLNADGTNDSAFVTASGTGLSNSVSDILLQPNGSLVVVGTFATASGTARPRIARYSSTGSFDSSFDPGDAGASQIYTVESMSDGRLLIGTNNFDPNSIRRLAPGTSAQPAILSITAPSVSAGEGLTASIIVSREGGSTGEVSVNYHTIPGTATTADFTTTSGTLTWAAGDSSSKTISVPITTDGLTDVGETFSVVLGIPLGGALLGEQQSSLVTITDGDTSAYPRANFVTTTSALTENEADPTVTVQVTLTAAAGTAFSIPLSFSGTATLNTDYTSSATQLDFGAADTTKSFILTVVDDSIADTNPETAVVTLGNPTGAVIIGSSGTHTLTLTDNEDAAAFITPPQSRTVALGSSATFSVNVRGTPTPTLQWFRNNTLIPGANGTSHTVNNVGLTSIGTFKVTATNLGVTATSSNAELAVADGNPKRIVLGAGSPLSLTLSAAGNGLSFRWYKGSTALVDGGRISGATSKALKIASLTTADSTSGGDTYHCVVSSNLGAADFEAMPTGLLVVDAPPTVAGPLPLPATLVGGDYNATATYIQVDAAENKTPASYSATGLPKGLSVDPLTGQIKGRAAEMLTAPKTFNVVLKATNARGSGTLATTLLVNPIPSGLAGVYAGYINRDTSLNKGLGGRLDLKVDANGLGSGKIQLGSETTSYKCQLRTTTGSQQALVDEQVARKPGQAPLRLVFTIDGSTGYLTAASVSDGTGSADINAWRSNFSATVPATAFAGYYTTGFKSPASLAGERNIPRGVSHGSFTIAPAGTTSLSIKLADGITILTLAAFTGPGGELLVYAPLYTNTGSLLGMLDIAPGATNAQNTLDGTLSWSRQPQTSATMRTYKAGFAPALALDHYAMELSIVGGRYSDPAPAGDTTPELPMGITNADQNARLVFTEAVTGLIPSPSPNIILTRLRLGGATALPLAFNNVNPRKVTLTVSAKTGAFGGTMTLVDQNPVAATGVMVTRSPNPAFRGFIVNDGGTLRGVGFFVVQDLPTLTIPVTKTDILSCGAVLEAN